MTTDTRDLTETELGYLGWQFEQTHGGDFYMMHLNAMDITGGNLRWCLAIANRIARAQGITPPVFQVGDRVVREKYIRDDDNVAGTVIRVQWADEWLYAVRFDEPIFEGGDSECSYATYELESVAP